MNENLDLTKILEECPKGTEFYSPLFGEVAFVKISDGRIIVDCTRINRQVMFNTVGKYVMNEMRYSDDLGNHFHSVECLLFPSKEQRDWSKFERFWEKPKVEKFNPKTFQPFDKVLARCTESEWMPTLFGFFIDTDNKDPLSPFENGERVVCVDIGYQQCIPYNEETKHLIGTLDDCPEYYKWWEE